MRRLLFALTAIALSALFYSINASAALYNEWHPYERQVFDLVNLQREHNGLSDLSADSRLQEAADLHSQDMAHNDFFSHDSQDGTTFSQRITAQGYDWYTCGENIAAGYPNAYRVMYGTNDLKLLSDFDKTLGLGGFSSWEEVGQGWSDANWDTWGDGWMGSSGHRANILTAGFTDIGVGYYFLASDTGSINYYHYWTEDFAAGDTAVPIPATILLFGGGLLGMAGVRRYNKK